MLVIFVTFILRVEEKPIKSRTSRMNMLIQNLWIVIPYQLKVNISSSVIYKHNFQRRILTLEKLDNKFITNWVKFIRKVLFAVKWSFKYRYYVYVFKVWWQIIANIYVDCIVTNNVWKVIVTQMKTNF